MFSNNVGSKPWEIVLFNYHSRLNFQFFGHEHVENIGKVLIMSENISLGKLALDFSRWKIYNVQVFGKFPGLLADRRAGPGRDQGLQIMTGRDPFENKSNSPVPS